MFGVQLRCSLEFSNGPVIIPFFSVHDPHICAHVGVLGINLQGFGIDFYGLVELIIVEVKVPQLDKRINIFGVVLENGAERVDLFLNIRRWGGWSR